jgi:site-specific DNA-methyltransferase (adenine-specific)
MWSEGGNMIDYKDDNLWLMQGDCLERMKEIPDGSIDAIITDPPYKVTSRGGYTSAGGMMLDSMMRKGNVFKENEVAISQWLPILYQKLKESGHCYIMCNNKNLHGFLNAVSQSGFKLVKTMVWAKDNKIMSQAYMSQIEFVLFLRKGKFKKINDCGSSDLLSFNNVRNKNHPTEKPVDLISHLATNSSGEGDLILDPFMGSGTTGVACVNLNRKFIGIEMDEKYFNIGKDRVLKVAQVDEV